MGKINGRPPKAAEDTRGKWAGSRVTDDERAIIDALAAEAGLTHSAYCRAAILNKTIAVRHTRTDPEMISLMRRASNNLHQVMKDVRFDKFYPGIEGDLRTAIQELAEAFRRVHGHDP